MQVNLFFDWLSNGELLTLKTGPPCRNVRVLLQKVSMLFKTFSLEKIYW